MKSFLILVKSFHYNFIKGIKYDISKKYLDKIKGFYDSDLIKVITGIRRCGKSVILNEIMDTISKKLIT